MTTTRPRLLDAFAGEGGAGEGYRRAGFHVTAIDTHNRVANHPGDEKHLGNALEHIEKHGHKYDVIHASPPCQGYSRGTVMLTDRADRYDRFIALTRDLLQATGRPYVLENVEDARPELISPLRLCGKEFGLGARDTDGTWLTLKRHRLFESNVFLMGGPGCPGHPRGEQVAGVYGGARRDKIEARTIRKGAYVPPSLSVLRSLIGAPWMSETGCFLSIPPAYTEFIGHQLITQL